MASESVWSQPAAGPFCAHAAHAAPIALTPPAPPRRFQWWRDALCNLFDGRQPPAHPVLVALAAVHAQTPLSRYQLRRLLDNREIDELSEQPPLTMAQLEDHVEGTASQLHYLQLSAAGELLLCMSWGLQRVNCVYLVSSCMACLVQQIWWLVPLPAAPHCNC